MAHPRASLPIFLHAANDNVPCRPDTRPTVTIREILAEPMVRDLMRADGVDPREFEALLRSITRG